jgi:hypothetical protein
MPRASPPRTWYMIQVTLGEFGWRVVKRPLEMVIHIVPTIAKGV